MKVIREISFLLLLVLSVVACSDDESGDSEASKKEALKEQFKGTWELTSVLIRGEESITEESCERLLTFKSDRIFSIKWYSGENCSNPSIIEGEYVFNGETLEYYYVDDPEFTYSFDGTLENVHFAEDEVVLFEQEITFIDEDMFSYEIPYDYGGGIEYNIYTYKRVI